MPVPVRFAVVPIVAAGLAAGPVVAQPPAGARSESSAGAFLRRGPVGFEPLPANAAVAVGELVVALPGASLVSANGAVGVTSRADFDGASPLPVLETAVAVNPPDGADLDVTLDRGRIDLTSRKPAGKATARVRFGKLRWLVGLDRPGTRVAVEVVSRWPAGAAFHRTPADGYAPAGAAVLVVLAGTADVSDGTTTLALTAPPGPAMVEWTEGAPLAAARLDRLPPWVTPADGKNTEPALDAVERFRARLAAGAVGPAVDAMLGSAEGADRRVGLIAAGATDDLDRLTRAVAGAADPATWDFGVSVLRHWVGRGPGQDAALFRFLVESRRFTPAQAETTVRLLHGFAPDDRTRPETFEVLVGYLRNEQAAVRNLAAWHLGRLVPAGKAIPFRPNATRAESDAAARAWAALVPPGQVPPGLPPARSAPPTPKVP